MKKWIFILALSFLSVASARVDNPRLFIGEQMFGSTAGSLLFSNGSALTQNNSKIFWDNTNYRLGIGTAVPDSALTISGNVSAIPAPIAGTYNLLHVASLDGVANSALYDSFGSTVQYIMRRADGTAASPSAIQSGDILGQLGWLGYGATSYQTSYAAKITSTAAETWTDSTGAAIIQFFTRPSGTTSTSSERMRIDQNGNVGIGTTTTTYALDVSSTGTTALNLTGNSVGGTSSGTGSVIALNYNTSNNKQILFGDADYLGNASGSFIRQATVSGAPILDAISGTGGTNTPLCLGSVGGSKVVVGNNTLTQPGSQFFVNGNAAVGSGYSSSSAPTNGLAVQGNLGVGVVAPVSSFQVNSPTGSYDTPTVAGFFAPADTNQALIIARNVTQPQEIQMGVNQAGLYSEIQATNSQVAYDNLVLNRQGGNVGIANAAPSYTLDVAGTIRGTTNIIDQGIATSAAGAPLSITSGQVLTSGITNNATTSTTATASGTTAAALLTTASNPAAGTYLVTYSGNITAASAGGNILTVSIYVGGTQNTNSIRTTMPTTTAVGGAFMNMEIGTNAIVTVNGSQAIAIYGVSSAGTVTTTQREMDIIRLQ